MGERSFLTITRYRSFYLVFNSWNNISSPLLTSHSTISTYFCWLWQEINHIYHLYPPNQPCHLKFVSPSLSSQPTISPSHNSINSWSHDLFLPSLSSLPYPISTPISQIKIEWDGRLWDRFRDGRLWDKSTTILCFHSHLIWSSTTLLYHGNNYLISYLISHISSHIGWSWSWLSHHLFLSIS